MCDLLWELQAQVVDRLSREHLLGLEELFPHECLEIVVEYVLLELSKLHRQQLLDNPVMDEVALTVFEVVVEVHAMLQLTA